MTKTNLVAESEKHLGEVISQRVAALRRHEGLSLDRLANRAGLSKGTVVGIENAQSNPSIGVLCKLAAALSVSVSDLMDTQDQDRSGIEQTNPHQLWTSDNGGMATLLAALSGQTMFELWSWKLGPDDRFESDAHSPGTAELISVQDGTLEITVGLSTLTLKSGEAAKLRTDKPHSYKSVGRHAVSFTMAVLERGAKMVTEGDLGQN